MDNLQFFYVMNIFLGLVLGSFYNVCIARSITEESIVRPARSKCPACGHKLGWWENIPLVSYLILAGRCHKCKGRISLRYPLVEALSALICLAFALKFGPGAKWAVCVAFSGLLLVLGFIDLETMYLLIYPIIAGTIAAVICAPLFLETDLINALAAAAAGAGFFWLVRYLYLKFRGIEGLGEGDVWLMLLIGPLVGIEYVPLVVMISGIGLILCSVFFLKSKKHTQNTDELNDTDYIIDTIIQTKNEQSDRQAPGLMQTPIPYGPFLCAATIIVLLAGKEIMAWYQGLLHLP